MVGALVKLLSYPVQETRVSSYSPGQITSTRRAKAGLRHRLVLCENIRVVEFSVRLKPLKSRAILFLRRIYKYEHHA